MKASPWIPLLFAFILAIPTWATAENSTSLDGFTVHHNAFSADTLTPQVASAIGIHRSKYHGLLNVSVIKEIPGTAGTSVPAQVHAEILLLNGQKSLLAMREIHDGGAIYYIGSFPIENAQTIDFAIKVKPLGSDKSVDIRMEQEFFTE